MNIIKSILAVLIAGSIGLTACGPRGEENATNTDNSAGEGAIDTTRIPGFDTSQIPALDPTNPYNNDTLQQRPTVNQ